MFTRSSFTKPVLAAMAMSMLFPLSASAESFSPFAGGPSGFSLTGLQLPQKNLFSLKLDTPLVNPSNGSGSVQTPVIPAAPPVVSVPAPPPPPAASAAATMNAAAGAPTLNLPSTNVGGLNSFNATTMLNGSQVQVQPVDVATNSRVLQPTNGAFIFAHFAAQPMTDPSGAFEVTPEAGSLYSFSLPNKIEIEKGSLMISAKNAQVVATAKRVSVLINPGATVITEVTCDGKVIVRSLNGGSKNKSASAVITAENATGQRFDVVPGQAYLVSSRELTQAEMIPVDGTEAPVEGRISQIHQIRLQIQAISEQEIAASHAPVTHATRMPLEKISCETNDSSLVLKSKSGNAMLVRSSEPYSVTLQGKTLRVEKNAVAIVQSDEHGLKVINLSDLHTNTVSIQVGDRYLHVLPGQEVLFTKNSPDTTQVFDEPEIGHRGVLTQNLREYGWLTLSEVSLVDVLKYHPMAASLRGQHDEMSRAAVQQVIKTAAIFQTLRGRRTYLKGEQTVETQLCTAINK